MAKSTTATSRAFSWFHAQSFGRVVISALILIPCFWHPQIQACDLGSHLYTAWLTQAVERGLLTGLHIESQHTNILIDLLLSKLLPYVGIAATQRIVVGFCVLVFFWGAFAFVSAAAKSPAWKLMPLLAMVSYGVIFHWGFFNFYLSAGFSLWALAIIVRGVRLDFLWIPPLFVLAALAHPMGAACVIALGIYLALLRWLRPNAQLIVSATVLTLAFGVREYLVHHFEVLPKEVHAYWLIGADQLYVYDGKYLWIAVAALALCVLSVISGLLVRDRADAVSARGLSRFSWLQFYSVIAIVVCFAPGGLSSEGGFGMMGYLPDRGSLYSAVALAALIACCRPRGWFVLATLLLAIPYFALLFRDTSLLQRRTEKVEALVRPYPHKRIVSILPPIPGWRVHEDHSLDRACVGQCYSFNNYEPSTFQFRLRADPGNRVIEVDQDALDDMKDGNYEVKSADLPLYEVYSCGAATTDLCIDELHAGQLNGNVPKIYPPRE